MKLIISSVFALFISFNSFSQIKAIDAIKQVTGAFTEQDTTSKKKNSGASSNLAVSDEGVPKTKENKKVNPIGKVIEGTTPASGSGSSGTSNLAVSDEGVGGKGKGKTNRETNDTTVSPSAEPKTGETPPAPK